MSKIFSKYGYQTTKLRIVMHWLVMGALGLIFLIAIYELITPANTEDIKSVIIKAAPSIEATSIVKAAYLKTPSPTLVQLAALNTQVDKQLLIEAERLGIEPVGYRATGKSAH